MWKAVIVADLDISDIIRYIIEVSNESGQWIIRKRYSDFSTLHKDLNKKFQASSIPTLPPKCFSLLGPDKAFLEERKSALQRYLDVLCASKDLCNTKEVTDFIKPEKPTSPAAVTLPSQLPDVPSGDHSSADLTEVDRLLTKPRTILRSLFISQQELEIDPLLSARISSIDFKRRGFMSGSKSLKRVVIEMYNFMNGVEGRDPSLAEYMRLCISLTLSGIKWVENVEKEETPLIKYFLTEAKAIRPISIYEELARRILAKYPREQWSPVPEDAQRLVASIRVEREHRKKVGQLIAWQLLREIQHSITDTTQDGVPIGFRDALSRDDTLIYIEFPRVRREFLLNSSAIPGYSAAKIMRSLVKRSRAAVAELNDELEDIFTKRTPEIPRPEDDANNNNNNNEDERTSSSMFRNTRRSIERDREAALVKAKDRLDRLERIGGNLKELCVIVDDLKKMIEENPTVDWNAEMEASAAVEQVNRATEIQKEVDPMASSIIAVPLMRGEKILSPPQPPSPQISGNSDVDDDDDDELY